jgi:RNA polymerase sigma factor (sigma-70 family)
MLSDPMDLVAGTRAAASSADEAAFTAFVDESAPRLLRALVAAFGREIGREATLDALAWGWEHRQRLSTMRNPTGYLYRVGQTSARRALHQQRRVEPRASVDARDAAPDVLRAIAVEVALATLSPRQRAAAVLVYGHGVSLRDAAAMLGCSVSALRNHLERAARHLRAQLGDGDER